MADDPPQVSPPYATFGQFKSFLNKLAETSVPSRIDRTVFGNISGGTAYALLSALKFLRLIDGDGKPTSLLRQLVTADEDGRKPLIHQMIYEAYPGLMNGSLNLAEASGGQFDEALREHYNIRGSTVDKVATFFLQAAEEAGVQVSMHLKKRKPAAPSNASRRRPAPKTPDTDEREPDARTKAQTMSQKSLSHVLTDLLDVTDMNEEEMNAVWVLLRYQKRKEATALGQKGGG